jgi:threonine aldolase
VTNTVANALARLPRPSSGFGSDNQSGVHPAAIAALAEANVGHCVGYGDDRWTLAATELFREQFGADTTVLFTWNGSGANVLSLATLLPRWGAVLCPAASHIEGDEQGASEAFLGNKIIGVPTIDQKLRPEQIDAAMRGAFGPHHVTPRVVSITQSTESGTLYSVDEVAAICETAHRHGLFVHVDGARIANATAALGVQVSAHSFDVGVDALSFGGTKNGMMYGEAVLLRRPEHALAGTMLRKTVTQLASKMRFIGAQFEAMLRDDLWLTTAAHANAMATRLADAVRGVPGVALEREPTVNSLYPILPRDVIEPLQAWCQHYTWDAARNQVRWVCSWDTTVEDVDRFAAGVRAACAAASPH